MFELLSMVILGLLIMFIGWRIWKKEQITLIHDYHYTRVKEKDKKVYTEKMGKSCIIIGVGMALTGITNYLTKSFYGWAFFAIFFVWGLIKIFITQKKYNDGL